MQANFTDLYFDECGASFKIIRQWVVIDWCTSQTENINQTIKIQDSNGPSFACPNDTIIGTDVYSCTNAPYTVMLAAAVMDCSAWDYTIQVLDANGIDQTAAYVDGLILQVVVLPECTPSLLMTKATITASLQLWRYKR